MARQARIGRWQRKLPGPAPVLTIGRCDAEGESLGLYHLARPYLIEDNAETRIVRCPMCELFAWREKREPDQCRPRCRRTHRQAPGYWWEDLLDPRSGLIRQDVQLRAVVCAPSITAPKELRIAAEPMSAMAALFVEGVGHCLQMVAAVNPADRDALRTLSSTAMAKHDAQERRDMWRYAALLQGIAAGQLPLRLYWNVHALLQSAVVPETESQILTRVQVNTRYPYLWRLIGTVL